MERFSHRESVLLGYSASPLGSISLTNSNSSPRTPCRSSDVFDFHDVFGGPPRRASAQEKRCSFSEATEFYGEGGDHEALSCTRLGEKPVFGEENANRRRYTSNDFFDDIFRGDESLSSTPRKRDRDPFASAPGSRVLSPARPLPPKAEPFGSSSMPPEFRLGKGMELDVFGGSTSRNPPKNKDSSSSGVSFSSSSSSNLSRFSSQSVQSQEELGNDVQSCHRQRPLSREVFLALGSEGSSNSIKSDKMEPNGSEVPSDSNQFHFSIYKWASKGVPLAMPYRGGSSRMKESVKFERCSSWNAWLASERKARICNRQEIDSTLLTPESEPLSSLRRVVEDVPGNAILHDFCDTAEKEITVLTEEVHKPVLKPQCSLFFDDDCEQGTNAIPEKGEGKESTVKSAKNPSSVVDASKNVKKQDGKRTALNQNDVEADKGSFRDLPIHPGDNLGRNRVKGKVKEFVKIFSQEASPKPKEDIGSRSQSSKWKKKSTYRAENEISVSAAGLDEKIPRTLVNNTIPEASIMADESLKQSEKEHSAMKTTNHIFSDTSSGQKDNSSSTTASISNGSKATTMEVTDESFHVNFQTKDLTHGANELPQSGDDHEEIQGIDAKIRQWSNGKKGNIRSLLSTLQYVLWPESGWKPVPLVDIIEGNSVKRAYQKALLCLHPDKLQQKGAASHQKYIAEQVFEILQDAWNQFNSLGSL
ncbi:J domain-containing protein required for chloroplast accumulation response 1 isoform X2 [Alnus glutinosa]|uniref:J domain-containing protein required for chloroplast accumulation response 1 isoform X2 n=1 Tax=Alnus glutinosa TaxID=3517 RepID=UPI002D78A187|nr:J domain-containing protein required for chloroplast accumulation response 1 isoform X2 [Alnus glutinosa]